MMRVISAPRGLKWAAAAVFLTVPIAAIESMVMARAPWWALPVRSMEIAAAWALGISIILSILLLQARRGLHLALLGIGALWVLLSVLMAIRTHNPGMGFFSIFLAVYFGLLTSWVKHEFCRSFFNPAMAWFEGAPRSIPALACEIVSGEQTTALKVSRLDEEGAFVFIGGPRKTLAKKIPLRKQRLELLFRFRDQEVSCHAIPMLFFKRSSEGVGLRFDGNTPDQRKKLGDFIETLRGEGYV